MYQLLGETVIEVISCLRRQCFVWGGGDFLIRVLELIFEGIDFLKTINVFCS